FSDTQCGFKIYDGIIARDLFSRGRIDGFLFEIEILRLAKGKYISMKEMPIEWTCDRDSRLSFIPTIWEVLRDSWKLKFPF
ncbi:MAG: glycosyltransferase family 2 protein, partial [Candidatus Marinimicrobia bacterium]|nr:glycosyltransferase family 2 protein [Candidatus Neomarinimicrobiota bacterium]